MKKILYSFSFFLTLSLTVQAQTTVKKVMLEDFTGTWCQWCPEGTVILEGLLAANPTTFIPIASHNGDALQVTDGAAIDAGLNVTAYPNGAVDRFQHPGQAKIPMSRGSWTAAYNARMATPAIASIGFENPSFNGTNYTAKVNVKFTSAPTAGIPIKVNVYITEDSIPATGANAQTNSATSSVQGGVSPLVNWFHNATLRDATGGAWGYATTIPATPVVGTKYTENVTFTIPAAWVKKNINIVAFVAYDGAAASNQKEILNVDQLALKFWNPTGVNDVNANNSLQLNLYPNPAKNNSFVKFSFNLNEDANVKMEVLNAFGQVISKPYSSFEIAGLHTIQWNPQEFSSSIAPGMYFVKITSDKGQSGVSKLIIE